MISTTLAPGALWVPECGDLSPRIPGARDWRAFGAELVGFFIAGGSPEQQHLAFVNNLG